MNTMKNKVSLIGHLGNDPEIRLLEGDKKMGRVSIAVNENYKNAQGERIANTTWFTLVVWGALVDVFEKYTSKGSQVAVDGKLVNRNYEDKDGIKRYVTEIHVSDVLLLGNKEKSSPEDVHQE
jgi:single-strand DNA-binding protein